MKKSIKLLRADEPIQKGRRIEDPAVRREQLIIATIDCIAKYGISGTTLSKVTEAAGLSLGLVNFHFASKDRLLEETIRFLAIEFRDTWQKAQKGNKGSDAEQLLAIVDTAFNAKIVQRKRLAVWFAFFGEASNRKTYLRISEDLDTERFDETIRIITAMTKDSAIVQIDPIELTLILESLYDGIWLNMLLYPEEFSREAGKNRVYQLLLSLFPDHFGPLISLSKKAGEA